MNVSLLIFISMKSLTKLKTKRTYSEEGFTLIELMIVVIIIGILAAIAIPIFANQQKSALDASIKSDVKNVVTAVYTWQTKNPTAKTFDGSQTEITNMVKTSDKGTFLRITGTPFNWCVSGGNPASGEYPGAPRYLIFESKTGKNVNASQGVLSTRSCSSEPGGVEWMLATSL